MSEELFHLACQCLRLSAAVPKRNNIDDCVVIDVIHHFAQSIDDNAAVGYRKIFK